jgi:hypothetical protein
LRYSVLLFFNDITNNAISFQRETKTYLPFSKRFLSLNKFLGHVMKESAGIIIIR